MPNFIISPARLKLSRGEPIPEFVPLQLQCEGLVPSAKYFVSLNGVTLLEFVTSGDGAFLSTHFRFYTKRMGDFQFELSRVENAPQGSSYIEANRAFRIECVTTIRDQIVEAIAEFGPMTLQQIASHVSTTSAASLRVAVSALVASNKLVRSNDKWRSTYSLPEPQA